VVPAGLSTLPTAMHNVTDAHATPSSPISDSPRLCGSLDRDHRWPSHTPAKASADKRPTATQKVLETHDTALNTPGLRADRLDTPRGGAGSSRKRQHRSRAGDQ